MLRRGFVGAEAGDRAEVDPAWKEPRISRASIFLASIFLFPRRMQGEEEYHTKYADRWIVRE